MGGRNPEEDWDYPVATHPKIRALLEKRPRRRPGVTQFGQTVQVGKNLQLVETNGRVDSATANMVKKNLLALFGSGPWGSKEIPAEPDSAEPTTDAKPES